MTTKHVDSHLESFLDLMKAKGYDGYFLLNASYPGKLKDSLGEHVQRVWNRSKDMPPFFLSTYSQWQDEQSPYIKCDFKVRYSHSDGFYIEKMDIIKGNQYGTMKTITLPVTANNELPDRIQANQRIIGSERKVKMK